MIFGLIFLLIGLGLILIGLYKVMEGLAHLGLDEDTDTGAIGLKYLHWGCISQIVGNILMAVFAGFPVIFIILTLITGFLAYKSKKLWDEAQSL